MLLYIFLVLATAVWVFVAIMGRRQIEDDVTKAAFISGSLLLGTSILFYLYLMSPFLFWYIHSTALLMGVIWVIVGLDGKRYANMDIFGYALKAFGVIILLITLLSLFHLLVAFL